MEVMQPLQGGQSQVLTVVLHKRQPTLRDNAQVAQASVLSKESTQHHLGSFCWDVGCQEYLVWLHCSQGSGGRHKCLHCYWCCCRATLGCRSHGIIITARDSSSFAFLHWLEAAFLLREGIGLSFCKGDPLQKRRASAWAKREGQRYCPRHEKSRHHIHQEATKHAQYVPWACPKKERPAALAAQL